MALAELAAYVHTYIQTYKYAVVFVLRPFAATTMTTILIIALNNAHTHT